jgi:hypothetical protein
MSDSVQANQACFLSISSTLGAVASAAFNQHARVIDPYRRILPAPVTYPSGGNRGTLMIEPAEEEDESSAKEKKEKKKEKKKPAEENSKENGD